ncbi:MAG: glutamate synthase subunit beta [Saprospiraceae bacterium]|nr:glutamate synthase subunit beta [Saprospiraceae bacterium]
MGDPKGFLKLTRELPQARPPEERINDYKEIYLPFPVEKTVDQAARCMDCGIPFCHNGCPLGNIIPDFNDAVYREDWSLAYEILKSTNNFPEFTGRICPAPCETACVLGINQPAIAIEHIEKSIIEMAYERGLVKPAPPSVRTGKKVAVIGSGPAGLAAASQLNKAGHQVTVFERKDRIGGLLRYGIPDFKLEKNVIDRRLAIMEAEGIRFAPNADIGNNVSVDSLNEFHAICLCGGSTVPRDLNIPGRELDGIHFAMEFLEQNNRRVAGDKISQDEVLMATDKHVVVIGGGDTGSDCVGTSNRHRAKSVTQIELLAKPPETRSEETPWPLWPMMIRTSSSHEEGADRHWALLTKSFHGNETGQVQSLKICEINWQKNTETGRFGFEEVPGTEREIPCDLALLAIGYLHPQHTGLLDKLGVAYDERGNVKANDYQTSIEHIFSAGDMRRGQSLVVWAISEGREAARAIDSYLMGETSLEGKEVSHLAFDA